jgi:hypothetical protein
MAQPPRRLEAAVLWLDLAAVTDCFTVTRSGEGRMRFPQIVAITGLMLLCMATTGRAEKRVALVVGNAAYSHADKLSNPVNDA